LIWIALGFSVLFACGLLCLFLPWLDNLVGIRTGRDLRRVQSQRVGLVTLGDLVGPDATWTARHQEELWRTFIQCRTLRAGVSVVLHWEVDHDYAPHLAYGAEEGIFITPLTRETGRLAPALVPGGRSAEHLPESPFLSARAIYQNMGLAPNELPPDLARLLEKHASLRRTTRPAHRDADACDLK
jgi:hypothetical protein